MSPKFKRTYTAAQVEMQSKWELIEAIAEDAVAESLPISGIESRVAAKAALEAAGNEHTDNTVTHLCLLAKFDQDSSQKQRRVWRRYGWSTVYCIASAGWSQEAAYDFLLGDHKTYRDAQRAVGRNASAGIAKQSLDARWQKWLTSLESVFDEGAHLANESEATDGLVLGGYGQLGLLMYQQISESKLDGELRALQESV